MAFITEAETATLGLVHFPLEPYAEGPRDGGKFLMGREQGQGARAELERAIGGQRTGEEPIALDFTGVRAMSVPFAEAFFVPLLSGRLRGYYDEHPVLVVHAQEDVSETLAAVMRQSNLAVFAIHPDESTDLLGGEPALRESMQVAAELRRFSANDLARRLGLTAQAANNRLKELVRLGALQRVRVVPARGGREYEYRVPESADAT